MLSEIKDISDFKRLDKNLVYEMDKVLTHDIPLLLQKVGFDAFSIFSHDRDMFIGNESK